ncbi:fructose-bisphosphatase class III [Oceanobacillus caeni]|uniref:fructose-bisphosphatase class III n=1 Tax=Oceanobacillus TaxID=182709 RepID=UPI000621E4DE|nr:fructose-bisphosphatase class III [Oceanobacillus caeni]KKE79394.1 fructose 1,6-bisphosphatase [Bacilli bacterium VT-13-104]PZD88311.1 fructose-bisphosphatase class III [Bacilli bacterium]MBU8789669.1 fructose-bisphosphatase class III [Oceanobacillus caeni]MCR1833998.1 fructose-bisphosphatase class III [Oceanobacillus caeni]PZD90406.1 fructose-bisphosphatase class III [Bacilli bacterium]
MNKKYLDLLAEKYDSEEKVINELINLEAILNLPKGTEHFVSDLHGEFQSFQHVLRNGSGRVREKIVELFFSVLSEEKINELTTLVYYPEDKLQLIKHNFGNNEELHDWYAETIKHLVKLISFASSKYTRSKLRRALPKQFVYIIEELLYKTEDELLNKEPYYNIIVERVISLGQADKLIIGLAYCMQRLVVDHLHVVGDIYDRGPQPDKIMDTLIDYHSVDIQWGNHDVLWIGAFSGSKVCLANILRISARYDNLDIIEDVYGINLRPLLNLAEKYYTDNPAFRPKVQTGKKITDQERLQITKMHQAIAMIQFKLEMPIIKRRPFFNMSERLLLENIDYDKNEIKIQGKTYKLENTCFATVNPDNPEQLIEEEQEVIDKLLFSVQHSEKLARHIHFLMKKGSLYLKYNGNLLIHGCIPLDEKGNMEEMVIEDTTYGGRDLLDIFEYHLRYAFAHPEETDDLSTDMVWYLWTGEYSSLFGKRAMTTFERYFIKDKETHKETKNPYYYLRENEDICRKILTDFGLDPDHSHIINGHTPVKEIEGENPIKANGKMIVIDGGFSKAYQSTTGIAGYTLLYNSYGMKLVAHKHFNSKENLLENGTDVLSVKRVVDEEVERKMVRETNVGQELLEEVAALKSLLEYRYMK